MNANWIVPAFGVLLAAAWAGRDIHAPLEPQPRAARPVPPVQEAEVETDGDFWNAVATWSGDRDVLLRKTEDFLGMSPEEGRAFHSAALGAIDDVDRAWEAREEGLTLDPEPERESQSRYEAEKGRALRRMAVYLEGSERRDRLRERLDEWFDALR
jgi:hypothetical protein